MNETTKTILSDREAVEAIHDLLSGKEWEATTLDAVAFIIEDTGRLIADPEGENTMQNKAYEFHYDAGHGWLKVPVVDVLESGCRVSRYSYLNDGYVYLEEDCDAPAFNAATRRDPNRDIEISDGDDSPIRGYRHVATFDFLGVQ